MISVLIPYIRKDLHFSTVQYGYINGAFQAAYTIGFLVMGILIARFSTKIGYALSIGWWAMASFLHSTARSALQLACWRGMLGFGEAGNFPAAIKTVAEWFPPKDRAFATGIFNAGSNVAATVGPPVLVVVSAAFG